MNFVERNNLRIHNREPTRITDHSATVLDQCISNFSNLVSDTEILPPVASSDHCVLMVTCNFRIEKLVAYTRRRWTFKQGNYDDYRKELNETDWESCFNLNTFEDICRVWTDTLLNIAKKHIPNKVVIIKPRDKPWYNGHLRLLKRRNLRLFNKYKQSKCDESWKRFKDARKFYNLELVRIKHEYEQKQFEQLSKNENRNTKMWWKLLKEVTKDGG